MTSLIVNFPFISSNILAVQSYGVYISQHIRYSMDCSQNKNFLDSETHIVITNYWTQSSYVVDFKVKGKVEREFQCQLYPLWSTGRHVAPLWHIMLMLSQTTGPLTKYPFLKWQWIFFYPKQFSFLYNTDNNFTGLDYLSSKFVVEFCYQSS
jgi:hypothetical protein